LDSSQEKSLSVKHHRDKNRSRKSSKNSKQSSILSSSDSSSEEERKPKKKAVAVAMCKHCKQYGKVQHPERFTTKECMWNKKAKCYRYNAVCKQMGLKFVKASEFEKGKEDKWPKHKARAAK
jgi:hypothetical protein